MSTKTGQLLWSRQTISVPGGGGSLAVDTHLTQLNRAFAGSSDDEPGLGTESLIPPNPATAAASRIQVIPQMPLTEWSGVTHSEPYFNPTTQTVWVTFTTSLASRPPAALTVLFWNPHTLAGPGAADNYNALL